MFKGFSYCFIYNLIYFIIKRCYEKTRDNIYANRVCPVDGNGNFKS